ncbi:MAG: hypothetical protein ACTH3P_11230 [Proteus vulgaris]|uniref:hypothetical protein n=1 Tax=Proteus TaxID=583 RepID=UPI000501C26F|nr:MULTISPECIES: hypothetical protein [Proteus]KGA59431.1 hypothetical protein DR95_42 [Proteus vulgaris]MDC9738091.1 hypothetical protein [Proteus mirabilis]MDC9744301.1 hypothetical protein [Proteus mirabilis]HEJ9528812.1 hypothetical protein [Proteus mirabilis]HEJ9547444.1 hypothetical protein [Proteus mirabilis]
MTTVPFDITSVKEVKEIGSQTHEINRLLDSGEWVLLSVANGKDEMSYPIYRYSLGRIK